MLRLLILLILLLRLSAGVEREKPWRKSGHSSGACLGSEVQRDELAAVIDIVIAPDDHSGWISLASLTQCSEELGRGPVVLGHLQAMQHAGPPAGAVILLQPLRIRDVWRRGQVCAVDRSRLQLNDCVENRLDIVDAGGGGREGPDDPQGLWQGFR